MANELRARFSDELSLKLKTLSSQLVQIKPLKAGAQISFDGKKNVANIYFDYLRNAGGVYVGARVTGGVVHETLRRLGADKEINWHEEATMSFNSLSERFKEFSEDIGGVVKISNNSDFAKACSEIVLRVKKFHLRKLENFLTLAPELIADVQRYPSHYAFPFYTIALCLKKNGIDNIEEELEKYSKEIRVPRTRIADIISRLSDINLQTGQINIEYALS